MQYLKIFCLCTLLCLGVVGCNNVCNGDTFVVKGCWKNESTSHQYSYTITNGDLTLIHRSNNLYNVGDTLVLKKEVSIE